jgi:hypothetical protein
MPPSLEPPYPEKVQSSESGKIRVSAPGSKPMLWKINFGVLFGRRQLPEQNTKSTQVDGSRLHPTLAETSISGYGYFTINSSLDYLVL